MSKQPRSTFHHVHKGHSTALPYVFGFILSLEFTAIPYYLVINHMSVPGASLLVVLMVFAILQMLVQIFFFLHLGRGPKPLYNVGFFAATVFAVTVVTCGSVFIMGNLHRRMTPTAETLKLAQDEAIAQVSGVSTGACQQIGASHIVTITKGKVDIPNVSAQRCDTLTFVSTDAGSHKILFGPRTHPESYGGETEITVTNRKSQTLTLNQSGTMMFHDDREAGIYGFFTVAP